MFESINVIFTLTKQTPTGLTHLSSKTSKKYICYKLCLVTDSLNSVPPVSPGCELYAFCGALFGICSMITLMVIAVDRYFVITRPLASIGVLSQKRALLILLVAWTYSLGWSLPPFFGWSKCSISIVLSF